ncbi:MAG: hypothetical protein GEU88_04715 [Solirubrobacterales bacterium]|nr:hypothetical protein [Solirubrobacterales bacterium]
MPNGAKRVRGLAARRRRRWRWLAVALAALAVLLLVWRLTEHGESPSGEPGEAPAAQAPEPEVAADLPYFGFNELRWSISWQMGDPADPDRSLRLAVDASAGAGVNTNRLPIPWNDIIDPAGGWDEGAWARYRDAYEEMVARGVAPIVLLYAAPRGGVEQADPNWAPPGCTGGFASPPDPVHDADWQALVVRASNEFDQALALQIWNEPNSRDYWGGETCAPDPARYVQLVALARQALSGSGSEHPDRALVSAGLNPATVPGTIEWRDYLEATISAGLLDYVQAVGLHPYPLRGDCDRAPDPALALSRGMDAQLAQAAAIVPEPTPIWVTEFGASSAAGLTTDCRALTEADQARALSAMYDSLAADDRVEVAIVHQLVDEHLSYPEQLPNHFGVMRDAPAFLEPKPAYWCLAERRGRPTVDVTIDCG